VHYPNILFFGGGGGGGLQIKANYTTRHTKAAVQSVNVNVTNANS